MTAVVANAGHSVVSPGHLLMSEKSEKGSSDAIDRTGEFFSVGSPLHAIKPGYIRRAADDFLYRTLVAGNHAHVIAPDRTGKSSLIAATSARLQHNGFKVAVLNLRQIAERDGGSDAGRWYHDGIGTGLLNAMTRAGTALGFYLSAGAEEMRRSFSETEWKGIRETAEIEGRTFGRSAKQSGCIAEAFTRRDACRNFKCFALAELFLDACLETGQREPAICEGAPSTDDLMATIYWRLARCEQKDAPTQACNGLMGRVQEYCARARH